MSYSWGSDSVESWNSQGFSYGDAKKAYDDYSPPPSPKSYGKSKKKGCSCKKAKGKSLDMLSAYQVSKRVMDAALPKDDKSLLKTLKAEDIIVVPGTYDKVENVLDHAETNFTLASNYVELNPEQIVLINCPGDRKPFHYKNKEGMKALNLFVKDGGFVVTTDWALDRVIAKAFPGYICHAGTDTTDDVVEVDLVASGSPYTAGLGNGSLKPIWWLEQQSYPIKAKRNKDIDILLASNEMKQRYGYDPIAVKFPVGNGRVVHVTSHFYLQTSKSKYEAQEKLSGLDFATQYIGIAKAKAKKIKNIDNLSFGALESAYTSVRFLHNILLEKARRNNGIDQYLDAEQQKQLGCQNAKSMKALPYEGQKSQKLI